MWILVYPNRKTEFDSKYGRKRSFSYKIKASKSFILTMRVCLWCPIMKRTEIIMWIHVYPNWKMNFDSKIGRKRSFSYETKASKSCIPTKRMRLWCQIMKRKENIMRIHVYPNWMMNFDSKIGRKRSFAYEAKASKSFIPSRGLCLGYPIMKRKENIMWIRVYPH